MYVLFVYSLAHLEDHLLQQVGELLHNGHGLTRGQTNAIHGRRGVVACLAESGWCVALALLRRRCVL